MRAVNFLLNQCNLVICGFVASMRKFISGLVLGAGSSQRLGQPKQLLPFRGTTLLGWVVAQSLRATALDEVVVVLGRAAEELCRSIDFGAAKTVENTVYAEGCS